MAQTQPVLLTVSVPRSWSYQLNDMDQSDTAEYVMYGMLLFNFLFVNILLFVLITAPH